ncbi:S8 family serine peptidase [Krasilnikovia sp. MM14-A1004]|uniref:S8 family serine peptidase n=1 Tax=Krasilnikovia sp. MM14-A1004 TaxID=3373541 RepID=UPI00399CC1E5
MIVAVIDSGVADHSDLSGSVLPGKDFTDPAGSGRTDIDGHGTAMAGEIAAHGRDESGALGIAPDAKILPVRVLTRGKFKGDLGSAVSWAVAHGAKVINISLGGGITSNMFTALKAAEEANVVVVASAGNLPDDRRITAPAFVPSVLAVGAVDRGGNRDAISTTGSALDLMAPGTDIMSLGLNNGYKAATGTSDSSAIVAGAAALIRSKYPELSAREVVDRLESTAVDKGAPGVDPEYGHGVVDIIAALSVGTSATTDQPSANPSTGANNPPAGSSPFATSRAVAPTTRSMGSSSLLFGSATVLAILGGLAAFLILRRRRSRSD